MMTLEADFEHKIRVPPEQIVILNIATTISRGIHTKNNP